MIQKNDTEKDTLKTGIVCCIHVMTVQQRMVFVSFSHQFLKRLMMMKLCHSNSGLKTKNSQILPPFNYH